MDKIIEFLSENNFSLKDDKLFRQAFIHRSFINENPKSELHHNERLEFLGDSVLELISTSYLYKKFPDSPEGELTAYRSALVNTGSLAEVASGLEYNNFLQLSRGESKDIGRARLSILADTYEAVLGAMYLSCGYEMCYKWVEKSLLINTDNIVKTKLFKDSKSYLQEKAQEVYSVTPVYKIIRESGPDHDKKFEMGVYFNDKEIAKGEGSSKQVSEIAAATEALKVKGWEK
jgi:ribonuclease-3